ncbi:hypothetical protein Taro_001007, partial [Colocasia esculenta]|nr:hypothetical protein [Colocasia esculenta]
LSIHPPSRKLAANRKWANKWYQSQALQASRYHDLKSKDQMAAEAHHYEGQSVTIPPFFDGEDYQYWKMRMECFIRGTDFDLWQVIEQGDFAILGETTSTLSIADKRNIEFSRLSACRTAKEMWDKLQVTYEGTDRVKQTRIDILVSQYEQFKMLPNENITQMYNHISNIIVGLSSQGKILTNEETVRKILRSLTNVWTPKVTAIDEAHDLT